MRNKILAVVADSLGMDVVDVNESTSLITNKDSLDRIGLFFDLQEAFGIDITREQGSTITTVGDVLRVMGATS